MRNKIFKKDGDGNWYNSLNGFYLGTDNKAEVLDSLYQDGRSMEEIVDHLMGLINTSFE